MRELAVWKRRYASCYAIFGLPWGQRERSAPTIQFYKTIRPFGGFNYEEADNDCDSFGNCKAPGCYVMRSVAVL